MDQRGQATPLLALVVVAAGGLVYGLGLFGGLVADASGAQAAADAAALAGAADGRAAAEGVATANGASLRSYAVDGAEVEVLVEVGDGRGAARARRVGGGEVVRGWVGADVGAGSARGATRGLAPALVRALDAAAELLGEPVPITSGYRSPEDQRRLWEQRGRNRYPVARPGTSAHERGTAVDVPAGFAVRLARVAPRVGLCRPMPAADPVHFELCEARR